MIEVMLIDDVTIRVKAGNGGDGAVAFNKNLMSLGPVGATGGNGGNVFIEGVADLNALNHYKYKKELQAPHGGVGRGQFRDGERGEDLFLKVPVGTVIHNLETGRDREIVKIGQQALIARGGKGGRGNFHFRSATNTSPRQFEKGTKGQEFELRLELKLIADVGLIGLPNVGKSNLLNELTNAKSKVANYEFTTLEPNLGAYYELILADIPGLIEGASEGKGLGIKFLRHIERTKILFHLVSADSTHPIEDYKTVRKELGLHNKELLEKDEYIFLSKCDNIAPIDIKKKITALKKYNKKVFPLSILEPETLEAIKKILNKIKDEKMESEAEKETTIETPSE